MIVSADTFVPVHVCEKKEGYPFYRILEINPRHVVAVERIASGERIKLFISGFEESLIVVNDHIMQQLFPRRY